MLPRALADQPFVVVDLETTGTSAIYDRVIEVAALRVRAGRIEDRFEALVDPRRPIPSFITRLTGIDQAMVQGRPTFAEVLPRLAPLFEGAILVAHNAAFDRGFLRAGFVRAGRSWDADWLCTLRLARRLLPGLRRYSLDALIEHFRLSVTDRHRARPDAEATLALLDRLLASAAARGLAEPAALLALQETTVAGRRSVRVDEAVIQSLPTGPGVYLLKDDAGHVVYVGKSNNVRDRVRAHLRGGSDGQPRLRKRLRAVTDVDAVPTGSDLEALLLESRLIKGYLPDGNVKQRGYRAYPFVQIDLRDPYPRLELTREPDPAALTFGPFRRVATVEALVEFLRGELKLRACQEPIRPGQRACPLRDLKKCLAPCVGDVDQAGYRQAVEGAIALLDGRDASLIERLEARMRALADQLRFEEAAELRDRVFELRQLVGTQQRLAAVAQKNLLVLLPSARPGAHELLLIRRGRLAHQVTVADPADLGELRATVRLVYDEPADDAPVRREDVDEMAILDAWLRQRGDAVTQVPVPPGPDGAESAVARLSALLAGARELPER